MPDELFHNPYHFVPVKSVERPDDIIKEDFEEKRALHHLTHDRYVNKTSLNDQEQEVYSGRIICRMITEDPIFIGDKRPKLDSDESHRVSHFELNGKPAIPASSIRGMISSLAEAASNSALRVLEERHYSYRVDMRDKPPPLGALGMIVQGTGEDGKPLRLRPLALPTLEWRNNQARIPEEYRKIFTEPLLKVYVNGYRSRGQKIEKDPGSFLSEKNPDSYCADKQEFW